MKFRVWRLELADKALFCQVILPREYDDFPPDVKKNFDSHERFMAAEFFVKKLMDDGVIEERDEIPLGTE